MHIVHGRYDVVHLPSAAFELAQAVVGAELIFTELQDIQQWNLIIEALVGLIEKCKTYFK